MSLHHSAKSLLEQIGEVVNQLSDAQYKMPVPALSNSSIGQHVRHTLEFFLCLMDGQDRKVLNYDNRKHDPFIEEEVSLALRVISSIIDFLDHEHPDSSLSMEANYSIAEDDTLKIPSSFYRELAYNIEHAIHHMALIKVAVNAAFPAVILPDHFGVASSTVRYQMQSRS